MGWIPYLSAYCQTRVGSYCYVPLCKMLKTNATRGPRWAVLIHSGKPLGMFDWRPGSLPWVTERDGRGREVVKSYLPVLNHRVEKR
jgi:hypothetical protein